MPHLSYRVVEQLNELADHVVEWTSSINFNIVKFTRIVFAGFLKDAERGLDGGKAILMKWPPLFLGGKLEPEVENAAAYKLLVDRRRIE